jgi:hypothetical protein
LAHGLTNAQPTSKKELLRKKSKFGSSKFDQYVFLNSWFNELVVMLTYLEFILGPPILGGHQNKIH